MVRRFFICFLLSSETYRSQEAFLFPKSAFQNEMTLRETEKRFVQK